jgi:hypothetical protein
MSAALFYRRFAPPKRCTFRAAFTLERPMKLPHLKKRRSSMVGWNCKKKGRDTQQFYDDFCFTSIDAPDLCKYAELQAERMKIRNRIGECEIRYWALVR